MSTRTIVNCDLCGTLVEEKDRVNAQVYGVDFHIKCLLVANPLVLLKKLTLDDITYCDAKLIYLSSTSLPQI